MTTKYTPNFGLALPDFRQGPWHDLINQDLTKIDSMLFSALSGSNVSVWLHNTHYSVGITALDDTDATIWMCSVSHTSALTGTFEQDRNAHPTFWVRLLTGFAPRGEWAQNTQYFPYDLAYDSGRGIMALCTTKHVSTAVGSILTDKAYWAFLLDMSDVGTIVASAVTYSNTASGLAATDVQHAIDVIETQVKAVDAINVTQGNQISAIQTVNGTQDNRLTNLENKTSFGVLTAPHFISTDSVTAQFGGGAAIGYYTDPSNLALRPPGNGTIYFQSQGGAATYGTWGSGGINLNGTLTVNGGANVSGDIHGNSLFANSGGMYCYGWGGNGNIGVIFLNSAQNHYLYHDGTNVSFSGIAAVYAGNGRLWGSNDALPAPNLGGYVTDGRLVYAGDHALRGDNSIEEPWGGSVVTGYVSYGYNWSNYSPVPSAFRHRYMQLLTGNRGWYTVGYA